MPNSYKTHTANGSTTLFSFAEIDGWISTSFIKVYVNSVLQTGGYTLVDLNTATPKVSFNEAPPLNAVILIQRETPSTVSAFQSNVVNFNNGSVLTEEDLDNLAKGLLHVAQEAEDTGGNALGKDTDNNWTASSRRIKNVGEPVAPTDVATRNYVDSITLYGSGVATPQAWSFTGNGSQTVFAWTTNSQPAPLSTEKNMFLVEVGGVLQPPSVYSCDINNLTFLVGNTPPAGTTISVRNIGSNRAVLNFNEPLVVNAQLTANTAVIDGIPINNGASNSSSNIIVGNGGGSMTLAGGGGTGTIGIGQNCLLSSTTGFNNISIGQDAGRNLTTGINNVYVGGSAGRNNNAAINNVVIGYDALKTLNNASGAAAVQQYNVVLGAYAGKTGSSGTLDALSASDCILIGANTNFADGFNDSNQIVIGKGVTSDGNNTTVIGNNSTTQTKLRGNLVVTGNGTSTFAGNIQVQATPASASDVCRKDYVDSLARVGATSMVRINSAGTGIASQTSNIFSLVGTAFRVSGGFWKGYRIDFGNEAERAVTTSADTGTAVVASALYMFIRTL